MEFIVEENRIYFEQDGRLLAQVTFPQRADGIVEIDHTFVDDSLRGQGIAGMLMQKAADSIRKSIRLMQISLHRTSARQQRRKRHGSDPIQGAQ